MHYSEDMDDSRWSSEKVEGGEGEDGVTKVAMEGLRPGTLYFFKVGRFGCDLIGGFVGGLVGGLVCFWWGLVEGLGVV